MLEGMDYKLVLGDCITKMAEIGKPVFDFAVFSPPFPQLFAYTSSASDIGNSENMKGDAKLHLSFFYRQLAKVVKPGRVIVVHVAQIPRMKRSGGQGLFDFRGMNIRLAERAGLIFDYDWMVRKNPQSQAIRNHSLELQFAGLERDRARSRGVLNDFLLKFLVPGDNAVPVCDIRKIVDDDGELIKKERICETQVSRNDWIQLAEGCWSDIRETDTLNVIGTKGKDDTRHICPLQIEVVKRLIRLYTNPNEIVFSPFAGIGTEGYCALLLGRRFFGCELKSEYFDAAIRNLQTALKQREVTEEDLYADVEAK